MSDLPRLATCSYRDYRRDMGTAVRITLGVPRWISLPDPRYSKYAKWPYLKELAPDRAWFDAPGDEFDRHYLAKLERYAADIERKLTWIEPEHGRLCVLCFERNVKGPHDCHRRIFAEWGQERWGVEIPELGGR
jgi:Protein of unknown function, DUF488